MIRIFPLVLLLTLSACGLRPLYSAGSTGAVAQTLQGIDITPIEGGKSGWLVRNALTDRLGSGGTKQYRLDVELDDKIEGFGVRSDDAVTRERRTLRARYKLTDASGKVVLDEPAVSLDDSEQLATEAPLECHEPDEGQEHQHAPRHAECVTATKQPA